ncbi:MAG: cyclic nucleotide-binding domain-containing protein [Spirochaetaceae bacterium]|nr:cyclic nucleotide-binding domain-containing protein [Spirochaetaceae bacterium]
MSDHIALFEKFGTSFNNNEIIFKEGEEGTQMYIIQEGSVRISRIIGTTEHIIDILKKGDFFGEIAIVSKIKRTATATAIGDVQLLAFNREGFIQMIEKNAKIALNIIDKLCKRLEHANLQIKRLVKKDIKSLIAMNLYYIIQSKGVDINNLNYDRTIDNIAKNMEVPVGLVKEKFIDFEKDSVITISDSKIIINNIDKLKE